MPLWLCPLFVIKENILNPFFQGSRNGGFIDSPNDKFLDFIGS